MQDKLGVSLGSFLPLSAIPIFGLPMAKRMSEDSGYDFWQVLPFRSVTTRLLESYAQAWARYGEGAWNPTTVLRHFLGKPSPETGEHTSIQDLFFPSPPRVARLVGHMSKCGTILVAHSTEDRDEYTREGARSLVEVNWHIGRKTISELIEYAYESENRPLCVDSKHLRVDMHRSVPTPFGYWKTALEALLPHTGLVHIQAVEGWEWSLEENSPLVEFLTICREHSEHFDFLVEYHPMIVNGWRGMSPFDQRNELTRICDRVKKIIWR